MRASLPPKAWAVWWPMLTHTAASPFPGSPQAGQTAFFPAADAAGFTKPRGSAAPSWLTLYVLPYTWGIADIF